MQNHNTFGNRNGFYLAAFLATSLTGCGSSRAPYLCQGISTYFQTPGAALDGNIISIKPGSRVSLRQALFDGTTSPPSKPYSLAFYIGADPETGAIFITNKPSDNSKPTVYASWIASCKDEVWSFPTEYKHGGMTINFEHRSNIELSVDTKGNLIIRRETNVYDGLLWLSYSYSEAMTSKFQTSAE
jgi:hypothetical protein